MEGLKEKKTRDVGFENVRDPNVKSEIIKITKCPSDATNFIFWYSKLNPSEWVNAFFLKFNFWRFRV
jgi:hypothetical protein